MSVLLRHPGIGLYYAGRKHWAGNRESALDLGTVERATELSREEEFPQMEVVITYGDSGCDIIFPLKTKGKDAEPAVAAAA